MLERLGLVLYWLACGLATLVTVLGAFMLTGNEIGKVLGVVCFLAAFLVWLLGRALRFILSGEE